MEDPVDSPLCDHCRKRRGRYHTCEWVNDVKTTTNLCQECFEARATPAMRERVSRTLAARCRFCGGWPCAGSTDLVAMMAGQSASTLYACNPCRMMRGDYLTEAFGKLPEGLSQSEQMEILRKTHEAADEHVRDWLRKNGS